MSNPDPTIIANEYLASRSNGSMITVAEWIDAVAPTASLGLVLAVAQALADAATVSF